MPCNAPQNESQGRRGRKREYVALFVVATEKAGSDAHLRGMKNMDTTRVKGCKENADCSAVRTSIVIP